MRAGDIDATRHITGGELVIGGMNRGVIVCVLVRIPVTVDVGVRVMVAGARGLRAQVAAQVMIAGQRAVEHEGKRRHDRQTSRDASGQQMGESNQPGRGFTLHCQESNWWFPASPADGPARRQNNAFLAVFGKINGRKSAERTRCFAIETIPSGD